MGLTIHDYVQRRQLTEAAKLLVFSDRPILEIALISGYESQQAFTNIFRQMYKKSPNEYRSDEEFYPLHRTAIAVMTINLGTGSIDFFGVHPLYRNSNIARLFLDKLMNELLVDRRISITTFRKGDKADTGYRDAYLDLGFAEAELLIEFGYPTQRLILASEAGGDIDEAP